MGMSRYVPLCMAICSAMYGYVMLRMVVYGYVGLYTAVYDSLGLCTAV